MTDRITLSVIAAGPGAAAEGMVALLRRRAMSPIVHEALDAGAGITDAAGRPVRGLAGSGAGAAPTACPARARRAGAPALARQAASRRAPATAP